MTHQLPMGMGVEIRQWKRLRMIKEIFSYFLYNLLRRFHHQPVIPQRGRCSHRIHHPHKDQCLYESRNILRNDVIVNDRLQHIRSKYTGKAADNHQNSHGKHGKFMSPHIGNEPQQRLFCILRFLIANIFCHYKLTPFCGSSPSLPSGRKCWEE